MLAPMSIWGKIAGGAAGFMIGGPIGALLGVVAGHTLFDKETSPEAQAQKEQVYFTMGVIALGAKLAKADGVVSRDEVAAFKEVFLIPPGEEKNVARVFDLAKQSTAGFEEYAEQMVRVFGARAKALEDVLDGLFHIAKADNVLHPSELKYIQIVTKIFGFTKADFSRIKARHMGPDKADPYVILGIERSATNKEIKKIYRKLVAENHPDKLVARGVPEEAIKIATEKIAAINAAYDQIEKERGL